MKKVIFILLLLIISFNIMAKHCFAHIDCTGFVVMYDHPDDSYDVSSDTTQNLLWNYIIENTSKKNSVAIIPDGFSINTIGLLSSLNQKALPLYLSFSPDEILKDTKVFVLPSGSLFGLERSQQFKDKLAQYVSNGGTIICLNQQHGYEYSALPSGQVGGYGWVEDQGCFNNAIYIDTYHQVLSGQSLATISAAVDGYFTSYPDSTTVLLRRTKNNEPAMIMYPYGKGWVIATTMYEDWAYGHGQSTAQGRALIRDIISWAKKPQTLPEIKPGQPVTVDVLIKNNSQFNASQVKFVFLDPNRNKVSESIQSIELGAGESISLPVIYNSLITSPLGIWYVNYELLDPNGKTLQSQTEGERFAISNPPSSTQPNQNFILWATSTTEQVTPGSTVILTIWVKNNSDTDLINASIKVNRLHSPYQTISNVNVAAHSEADFTFSATMDQGGMFEITLNDSNGLKLAYGEKGIWTFSPSARTTISLDKSTYKKEDSVNISETIKNLTSAAYDCEIKTYILNPNNQKVFDTTQNINLTASGQVTLNALFTIDYSLPYGSYIACADVYKDNAKIGGNSVSFTIPGALVSITPTFPTAWNLGNNSINFSLNNIGGVDLETASLKVEMKNPLGSVVYTETKQVNNLTSGSNQAIDFNANLAEILFGNYTLKYILSYDGKIDGGQEVILCQMVMKQALDKSNYTILDDVKLDVELANTGKFNLTGVLDVGAGVHKGEIVINMI